MTTTRMTVEGHEINKEKSAWFTLMESQSVAADTRSAVQANGSAVGVIISIVTSSGASTPNITPKLETVDDAGNVISLWSASAAITTDTTSVYVFTPGGATGFGAVTEDVDCLIPREWQLFLDRSTGSFTVEVHACYL